MHSPNSDVHFWRRPAFYGLAVVILLTLASTVWAGPLPASHSMAPDADALIRCEPSGISGEADVPVFIDIYVQDVADLYGADVRLTFDTTIAQVVDADPATAGVQIQPISAFLQPDFIIFKSADNTAGTIHYALTQLNPSQPATGSGALARVQLQPLQAGEFTMSFVYHMLSDRNGIEIPSSIQDCEASFSGETPIGSPTPSPTPTVSATPAPPDTPTPTATATATSRLTSTPTTTPGATTTLTASPNPPTATPTEQLTATPSATASSTPVVETATHTVTPTLEPENTPSATPSATAEASSTPTSVPAEGSIQGMVFLDSDRDGTRDLGERGIDDVLIWAYGINAGSSYFMFTQDDGSYRLSNLSTGVLYLIQEFDPPGFVSTTPNWAFVELTGDMADGTVIQLFGDWRQETHRLYMPLAAN